MDNLQPKVTKRPTFSKLAGRIVRNTEERRRNPAARTVVPLLNLGTRQRAEAALANNESDARGDTDEDGGGESGYPLS